MTLPATPLFTDLYELTMMQGYWREGIHRRRACFEMFFRRLPFGGGYAVAAGIADVAIFLNGLHFTATDLDHLRSLGMFSADFLAYLRDWRFTGNVDAVPEGSCVFPYEPVVRVCAPLDQGQVIESALLNAVNFQTLIATKAMRICRAAGRDNVLEFGMRRAQGADGALSAARAAYIGGCAATSNVEAGRQYGIPARGTQAHSWIMAFPDELTAFRAYCEAYPENGTLLVDTYDTLRSGVPHAIQVAHELEQKGHRLFGIRLDSGDLAALAKEARRRLDEANLPGVKIVASGDLDEYRVAALLREGAPSDQWGIGTRLVTAQDDPSLTGVYKLAALEGENERWECKMKRSDSTAKTTVPGMKDLWRLSDPQGRFVADVLELETAKPDWMHSTPLFSLETGEQVLMTNPAWIAETILRPLIREGIPAGESPSLAAIKENARREIDRLPAACCELIDPAAYPVLAGPELGREIRRGR